jgi:hypothetical protein
MIRPARNPDKAPKENKIIEAVGIIRFITSKAVVSSPFACTMG